MNYFYAYVFITVALSVIYLIIFSEFFAEVGFAICNPKFIYKKVKVNWFGAILLALVANICLFPCTACYWLYKLCTVGRK